MWRGDVLLKWSNIPENKKNKNKCLILQNNKKKKNSSPGNFSVKKISRKQKERQAPTVNIFNLIHKLVQVKDQCIIWNSGVIWIFLQEVYRLTACWNCRLQTFFFFIRREFQYQGRILVIRCLTPEIPRKKLNKLCYSLCLNELCKCMWQVDIGGLWRSYSQPPHSADPRRPQPNEDWTLIIRRIWLPHETDTHTHTLSMSNNPAQLLPLFVTHIHVLTSQGFRCRPVLCRLYTQSLCRQL